MAILTPLPESSAQQLLSSYGLELIAITPLSAGSVNSNFFVDARFPGEKSAQRFFARLYEEQDESGARFEVVLNQRLLEAKQPVAAPVFTSEGNPTLNFDSKPFALYERLEGEVLCQARVTTSAVRSVGSALAGVHQADLKDLSVPLGRFGFDGMLERLERVEASGRGDLVAVVGPLRDRIQQLRDVRRSDLPCGLTHGDLFRDNVLVRADEVSGLLDFESASLEPYVYDLMVTVLAWCYGSAFDETLIRALFEGYTEVRPLERKEVDAMAIEGSVACLRFACTRLTDFSLRVPEGTTPKRHYRRFLDRMEALQSGVLERALRGLT